MNEDISLVELGVITRGQRFASFYNRPDGFAVGRLLMVLVAKVFHLITCHFIASTAWLNILAMVYTSMSYYRHSTYGYCKCAMPSRPIS